MEIEGSPIRVRNIWVGDVWVCSGQSNMQMQMSRLKDPLPESYPKIRMFTVRHHVASQPQSDVEGEWTPAEPATVGNFSAVGYYFGKELHERLRIPIGLINAAWGGSMAEFWARPRDLESDGDFKPIFDRSAAYPEQMKKYREVLDDWKQKAERAQLENRPPPDKPRIWFDPSSVTPPSGLYHGMIAPLMPYAIKGVIFYQGEANTRRSFQYQKLFPAVIRGWRGDWGQGDFPFLFVQLPNFRKVQPQPGESEWAELREAQSMALSLPNTGMAVAIDLGEAEDLHPRNKRDVGRRLALAALAVAYGQKVVDSGPIYQTMDVRGDKVHLRFRRAGGGLRSRNGEALKGFAIAGEDRRFVWADAKIHGKVVVVWSREVRNPVAVRYGWADNPECNLLNREGLPASPFRTDTWPGITHDKR
jgi:sialate O-acetylesterase